MMCDISGLLRQSIPKSCIIVGLTGNLIDKLAVYYLTVGVNDNDSTGKQPLERTIDKFNAIRARELRRTERRRRNYILQPFERTESSCCKRQVDRHTEHYGILFFRRPSR